MPSQGLDINDGKDDDEKGEDFDEKGVQPYFQPGATVRDPHHCETPTRSEQDLTCEEPEFRLC